MTIQIPPTKKRKFANEQATAAKETRTKAASEAKEYHEDEEEEEEDDDLDHVHEHKQQNHTANNENDNDSVEHELEHPHFPDNEDINVSIQKAIKIIQQTQEHNIAAFQQLLDANNTHSNNANKNEKKVAVQSNSRMTRNHHKPSKAETADKKQKEDLNYIEPTDKINDVTFKVTL